MSCRRKGPARCVYRPTGRGGHREKGWGIEVGVEGMTEVRESEVSGGGRRMERKGILRKKKKGERNLRK